jgi:hypothetical protein
MQRMNKEIEHKSLPEILTTVIKVIHYEDYLKTLDQFEDR